MIFTKGGPDIPNVLLDAQLKGDVLFFCGAGISRACAGLPSFLELTEDLATRLHISTTDFIYEHIFKRNAHCDKKPKQCKQSLSFDEVYSHLFTSYDNGIILGELASLLCVDDKLDAEKLTLHTALISLADSEKGFGRIITTNHDNLFERADIQKITGTPRLRNLNCQDPFDSGIWYLHGAFLKGSPPQNRSDLALCSASIGALYFNNNASLIHALRNAFKAVNHVIFIGYSGNDHIVRTLLDAYNIEDAEDDSAPITNKTKQLKPQMWSFCTKNEATRWKLLKCTPIIVTDKQKVAPAIIEWSKWAQDIDHALHCAFQDVYHIKNVSNENASVIGGLLVEFVLNSLFNSNVSLGVDWLDAVMNAPYIGNDVYGRLNRFLSAFKKILLNTVFDFRQTTDIAEKYPTATQWLTRWIREHIDEPSVQRFLLTNGILKHNFFKMLSESISKTKLADQPLGLTQGRLDFVQESALSIITEINAVEAQAIYIPFSRPLLGINPLQLALARQEFDSAAKILSPFPQWTMNENSLVPIVTFRELIDTTTTVNTLAGIDSESADAHFLVDAIESELHHLSKQWKRHELKNDDENWSNKSYENWRDNIAGPLGYALSRTNPEHTATVCRSLLSLRPRFIRDVVLNSACETQNLTLAIDLFKLVESAYPKETDRIATLASRRFSQTKNVDSLNIPVRWRSLSTPVSPHHINHQALTLNEFLTKDSKYISCKMTLSLFHEPASCHTCQNLRAEVLELREQLKSPEIDSLCIPVHEDFTISDFAHGSTWIRYIRSLQLVLASTDDQRRIQRQPRAVREYSIPTPQIVEVIEWLYVNKNLSPSIKISRTLAILRWEHSHQCDGILRAILHRLCDGQRLKPYSDQFILELLDAVHELTIDHTTSFFAGRLAAKTYLQTLKTSETNSTSTFQGRRLKAWLNHASSKTLVEFGKYVATATHDEPIELDIHSIWPRTKRALQEKHWRALVLIYCALPSESSENLYRELLRHCEDKNRLKWLDNYRQLQCKTSDAVSTRLDTLRKTWIS